MMQSLHRKMLPINLSNNIFNTLDIVTERLSLQMSQISHKCLRAAMRECCQVGRSFEKFHPPYIKYPIFVLDFDVCAGIAIEAMAGVCSLLIVDEHLHKLAQAVIAVILDELSLLGKIFRVVLNGLRDYFFKEFSILACYTAASIDQFGSQRLLFILNEITHLHTSQIINYLVSVMVRIGIIIQSSSALTAHHGMHCNFIIVHLIALLILVSTRPRLITALNIHCLCYHFTLASFSLLQIPSCKLHKFIWETDYITNMAQLALVISKSYIMRFDFVYEEVKNVPISKLYSRLTKFLFPKSNVKIPSEFYQNVSCTLQYNSQKIIEHENCYVKLDNSKYQAMLNGMTQQVEDNPQDSVKPSTNLQIKYPTLEVNKLKQEPTFPIQKKSERQIKPQNQNPQNSSKNVQQKVQRRLSPAAATQTVSPKISEKQQIPIKRQPAVSTQDTCCQIY